MSVGASRGLTLIEVAVAVAILGVTVVVAAAVLAQASRLRGTTQRDDEARAIVENEVERLRALPFWSGDDDAGQQEHSLVGAVFPQADVGRNTASGYFVVGDVDGIPDGTYVSQRRQGGRPLRVTARFAVSTCDGWQALGSAEVQGFSCNDDWRPPTTTMLVVVAVMASAAGASSPLCEQQAVIVARQRPAASLPAAMVTNDPKP